MISTFLREWLEFGALRVRRPGCESWLFHMDNSLNPSDPNFYYLWNGPITYPICVTDLLRRSNEVMDGKSISNLKQIILSYVCTTFPSHRSNTWTRKIWLTNRDICILVLVLSHWLCVLALYVIYILPPKFNLIISNLGSEKFRFMVLI